jgi:hypothetical protein
MCHGGLTQMRWIMSHDKWVMASAPEQGVDYVHCLGLYEYKLYTFFHVFCVYFVLISTHFTYSRVPGDQGGPIFFRLQKLFLAVVLHTNWCTTICITCPNLRAIVINEFVCTEFVLVLLQIDVIQFV